MSFFGAVSDLASKGVDWGKSAASKSWDVAKDLGTTAYDSARDAAENVADKYDQAKNYAGQRMDAGKEWAREQVVEAQADAAQRVTRKLLHDKAARDDLVGKLDKRDRFSAKVTQSCPNPRTAHPDKRDGQYLGRACPQTSASRPDEGVKPSCAKNRPDLKFRKVTFSNGINNTPEQVCATLHALADSRCVEVTGIYNATYADPSVKGPDRRMADYQDAVTKGKRGTVTGAASGAVAGGKLGGLPGAAAGAAAGALGTGLAAATPEVLVQEASRSGMVQDVIDCVKTINRSSFEAASDTLSKDIVAALGKEPPEPMEIYLHSQGGLNGAAAIAQAESKLADSKYDELMSKGISEDVAAAQSGEFAKKRLSSLRVNTFGTLERGLPDGPVYDRYTNELDPIPRVIREAQESYVPDEIRRDPLGATPTTRFRYAPSLSAVDAHGMLETYLPWLDKNRPKGSCCPSA